MRPMCLRCFAHSFLFAVALLSASAATFTVNSTGDGDDTNPGDGVCDDRTGNCTLRAAITEANGFAGEDRIEFDIPGEGPHVITVSNQLPALSEAVTVDGYTQPGANANSLTDGNDAVLRVAVDGGGSAGYGMQCNGPSLRVRGLAIGGCVYGIVAQSYGGAVIEGNFIGTDVTGTNANPNRIAGVLINVSGTIVGGANAAARNVISGNLTNGVQIVFGSGNVVEGNFIGTDVSGTMSLGNAGAGVLIDGTVGASVNTIGGAAPGARNVISGNGSNLSDSGGVILLSSNATANVVQGNFIGVDVTGTNGMASGFTGVGLSGAPGNTIADNVIVSHFRGIEVRFGATNNTITGNIVGADATATKALPNHEGIFVFSSAGTRIGGGSPASRNIVSGNDGTGIRLLNAASRDTMIENNFIGTDGTGLGPLGNGLHGIQIHSVAGFPYNNTVISNSIAFNAGNGVSVDAASNCLLSVNSIFANAGLGIDLGGDGVTTNDPGDADEGSNHLQNYPILTSVVSSVVTTISGTLQSAPLTAYRVEFFANTTCDSSNFGEGQFYLGSSDIVTDATGDGVFTAQLPNAPIGSGFVTATATDPDGNTSEFSPCAEIEPAGPCSELSGVLSKVKSKCKEKDGLQTCKLSASLVVSNTGSVAAEASAVRHYLSDDDIFDNDDQQISESAVKAISVGKSGKGKLKATLTNDSPTGRYLIAVIDADGSVAECNENNNIAVFGPLP